MSIPHLEDLPPRKFLEVMQNFWEYEATEKLDGSQLLFGIDEDGFYTSRESKGGLRIYNVDDYELSFKNTYIRSAHIALEASLDLLKGAGLEPGCQVEVEVLYGEFPNVVQYSPDRSFIIFLRTTEGNVNIDDMRVKLEGQSLSFPLTAPFTSNGKDIRYKEVVNTWEFARAPVLQVPVELNEHLEYIAQKVSDIVNIPFNESISVLEFLETRLNRRPEWDTEVENWSERREYLMSWRRDILDMIEFTILSWKKIMLDRLVRKQTSAFGPTDGWIEGIVFRHPESGHMFKLVDKELFLTVKDFYWKERNELFKLAKIGYNLQDLDSRLDKYEKDKSTFKLEIQKQIEEKAAKDRQTVCFSYGINIDTRTKEIYASLYQQESIRPLESF